MLRHFYSYLSLGSICLFCAAPSAVAAPTLSANPASLQIQCSLGTSGSPISCTGNTFALTSTSSVTFSASATVTSNGFAGFPHWLTVSPSSGTASSTATKITANVNPSGLEPNAPKTYSGTITITAPGAATLTVQVTLSLQGSESLTLNVAQVQVSAAPGGAAQNQNVTLSVTGVHSFNNLAYSAGTSYQSGSGWLSVSPASGSATAAGITVAINVNPAALASSSKPYAGTVTFTDTFANQLVLQVQLTVTAPTLSVTCSSTQTGCSPSPPALTITCGSSFGGSISGTLTTLCTGSFGLTSTQPIAFTTTSAVSAPNGFPGFPNWIVGISPASGMASSTPTSILVTANFDGLKPGGNYSASIVIHAPGASNNPLTVQVTLSLPGTGSLSISPPPPFAATVGGKSQAQTITVKTQGLGTFDTLAFAATVSNGGAWLSATPLSGSATATGAMVQITADPSMLPNTTTSYTAQITFVDTLDNQIPVAVTLDVTASQLSVNPTQLSFSYTQGGSAPASQTLNLTGTTGASVNVSASSSGNWLSVSTSQGTLPFQVQVTATPGSLAPNTYQGQITVQLPDGAQSQQINVSLAVTPNTSTVTQVIAHLADGGGWTTEIILVNTGTAPAQFELKLWSSQGGAGQGTTQMLNLGTDGTTSDLIRTIQPGQSYTIQTAGTGDGAGNLVTPWAEVIAPPSVGGTSIFTLNDTTEAAVPLAGTAGTTLYIPFDNTTVNGSSFATGIALANPAMQNANVSFSFTDDSGNAIPVAPSTQTVPARGHYSAVINQVFTATAGKRGIMQLTSDTTVYGIGIRSRSVGSASMFTSLPPLSSVARGNKTFAHLANSSGWSSTIILVNTDTVAASFGLSFYSDTGSPLPLPLGGPSAQSSITGIIQPGQEKILQTDGSGNLSPPWGWAELVTQNAIGGVCIFTLSASSGVPSEAAVPLVPTSSGGGKSLFIPYDNTGPFATGLALANPSASNAPITVSFTTDSGTEIQPTQQPGAVATDGHYAAVVNAGAYAPGAGYSRSDAHRFQRGPFRHRHTFAQRRIYHVARTAH